MTTKVLIWHFAVAVVAIQACQSKLSTISQRDLSFPSSSKKIQDKSEDQGPEHVLLKRRQLKVERKAPESIYGSLYEPNHERNHLFTDTPKYVANSFVDVAVVLNRQIKPRLAGGAEMEAKKTKGVPKVSGAADEASLVDAAKKPEEATEKSELDDILPKQFPYLDGGKDNPLVLKNLKMRVLQRLDNGDALVSMTRFTENDNETKSVEIKARIPVQALQKKELSTMDLVDIEIAEVDKGEVTNRLSSAWEDEYTMLLSGFNEAKSRLAQDIDARGKQLDSARTQLETRVDSFGKERSAVAKERERLAKDRAELDKKMSELQKTVDEQKKTIDELKPVALVKDLLEQKPGDAKEGVKK